MRRGRACGRRKYAAARHLCSRRDNICDGDGDNGCATAVQVGPECSEEATACRNGVAKRDASSARHLNLRARITHRKANRMVSTAANTCVMEETHLASWNITQ